MFSSHKLAPKTWRRCVGRRGGQLRWKNKGAMSSEETKEGERKWPMPDWLKAMKNPEGLTRAEQIERMKAFTEVDLKDFDFFMRALQLQMYTEAFRDEGYDDAYMIRSLGEEELNEVMAETKMLRGHQRKLLAWKDGVLVITGEGEYVTIMPHSEEFIKSAPPDPEEEARIAELMKEGAGAPAAG